MSVGPPPSRGRIFARGGKRDRRNRSSDYLNRHEAERLVLAIKAAASAGLPLQRFTTIHWERAGLGHGRGGEATSALVERLGRSIRKRGGAFAAVWTRENEGFGGKGDHAHLLLHYRTYPGLPQAMQRWIADIAGQPYRGGALKTRTIGGALDAHRTTLEHYNANLAELTAYVLKGVSPGTADALGLVRCEKGGTVTGKRSGMTRNLSRLVRGNAKPK